MGSSLSVSYAACGGSTHSINHCIGEDGWIDPVSFTDQCQRSHDEWSHFLRTVVKKRCELADKNDDEPAKKHTFQSKANNLEIVDASGNTVAADPRVSLWYLP
jgi:hypothetical protein